MERSEQHWTPIGALAAAKNLKQTVSDCKTGITAAPLGRFDIFKTHILCMKKSEKLVASPMEYEGMKKKFALRQKNAIEQKKIAKATGGNSIKRRLFLKKKNAKLAKNLSCFCQSKTQILKISNVAYFWKWKIGK